MDEGTGEGTLEGTVVGILVGSGVGLFVGVGVGMLVGGGVGANVVGRGDGGEDCGGVSGVHASAANADMVQSVSSIQSLTALILVYTPGYSAVAHPAPHETIPTWTVLSAVVRSGPPESPPQASCPPPSIMAQIIKPSIRG